MSSYYVYIITRFWWYCIGRIFVKISLSSSHTFNNESHSYTGRGSFKVNDNEFLFTCIYVCLWHNIVLFFYILFSSLQKIIGSSQTQIFIVQASCYNTSKTTAPGHDYYIADLMFILCYWMFLNILYVFGSVGNSTWLIVQIMLSARLECSNLFLSEITCMMKLVLGINIPYMILYIYFLFYLSILNPRWPPQQDKVKQRTIFSQKLQTWFNPNCTLIIIGWFLTVYIVVLIWKSKMTWNISGIVLYKLYVFCQFFIQDGTWT